MAEQCTSIGPDGQRCELDAGHSGPHSDGAAVWVEDNGHIQPPTAGALPRVVTRWFGLGQSIGISFFADPDDDND